AISVGWECSAAARNLCPVACTCRRTVRCANSDLPPNPTSKTHENRRSRRNDSSAHPLPMPTPHSDDDIGIQGLVNLFRESEFIILLHQIDHHFTQSFEIRYRIVLDSIFRIHL